MEYKSLVKNEIEKVDFTQSNTENSEFQYIGGILNTLNDRIALTTLQEKKKTKMKKSQKQKSSKKKKDERIKSLLECNRCEKRFLKKKDLIGHFKFHDMEIHKCNKCDRAFVSKNSLSYHMKSHAGIQYECDICNRKFNDNSNMKKHRNIHLGIKKYKCTICSKEYSDPSAFKLHQNRHAGVRYKCEFCEKSFSVKQTLKTHIRGLHLGNKQNLTCKDCSSIFTGIQFLMEHRNREHLNVKFECDLCQEVFYSKLNIKSHIITHPGMHLICSICKKDFTRYETYFKHISSHSAYVPCPQCPKQVKGKYALRLHIRTNHRKVKCSLCDKVFPTANSYKGHLKYVHKKYGTAKRYRNSSKLREREPYECFHCGKKYLTRLSLRDHIMIYHLQTDIISCELCQYTTLSLRTFKKHMSEHPIVKYLCKYCQETINDPDSFKDHLSKHFEIKGSSDNNDWKDHVKKFILKNKFKCNLCGTSFPNRRRLKLHMNTEHIKTKFTCHNCGDFFYCLTYLKEHLKKHDGLEFQCSTCKKHYHSLKLLKAHLKYFCLNSKRSLFLRQRKSE